jgi:hypothetical protein
MDSPRRNWFDRQIEPDPNVILEVPNSALGPKEIGLWARTLDGASGSWVQADRGARPAQGI